MDKKKVNYFKIIMYALVLLFFAVYILGSSNYNENTLYKNTKITNDAIKKFESDVINGEVVDVNSYIEVDNKDYSNKFTELGESLNSAVVLFFNDGIKEINNIVSYLLT